MPRSELLFLHEMQQSIERIRAIVDEMTAERLREDQLRVDALLWNFTVLGEAASKISEEFRLDHPEIPWQRPIGLRNRIVHGYWSTDISLLVTTAQTDLPNFRRDLEKIVARIEVSD